MGSSSVVSAESKASQNYSDEMLATFGFPRELMPRHIAIIMDGNGRWARQRALPRVAGHRQGVQSVRRTVEECCRLGMEQLTLYCLSVENWKRPKMELELLMHLLQKYLVDERAEIMDQDIRFTTIGRRDNLPAHILGEMDKTIMMSRGNSGMTLCLAISYGGRAEIVDAIRKIARKVQQGELDPESIDEGLVSDHLYTGGMSDPDVLIRTAGEMRVSNFLLWQISYAELWVTDVTWPEFNVEHLHQALRDYSRRDRRFGGLSDSSE